MTGGFLHGPRRRAARALVGAAWAGGLELSAAAAAFAQAHGPEGGGGSPLFSPSAGLALWTFVVFGLLLFILSKTAWKPLLHALERREARIQQALDEARGEREEAQKLLEEQRRLLAEAHGQAQDVVAQGRKAAEKLKDQLLEEGRQGQEEILARARSEIEGERERALEALRREAVDLSLAATAKLLRRQIDSAENRRLVEEFLDELSASAGEGSE